MGAVSIEAPSTIAASTTWPLPERERSNSAASTPAISIMAPPPLSAIRFSGGTGRLSSRPMACSTPE
jgi:hypothetical protein